MKKTKVLALVLALVMLVCCLAGCGLNLFDKSILTYDGFKVSAKHFALVSNINKDSYANNMGYVTGEIDESEYMTLKHILVAFAKEDGTTITEEEALEEANRIKAEITDTNFDELMAKYSEDPGSKSQPEGYTFAHNSGTMMQEFDDGGWALKVGEVSEPVRTDYGYHIIKRVELIKSALPKNINEINWEEETDPASGEPVLEAIKESAYSFLEERAILVKLAKDNDIEISKDDYEAEKEKTFEAMGGKEAAEKFFSALKYSNSEVKEFVELFVLPEKYYEFYNENLNHEEHFEAFLESDYYQEIALYYGVDYTEYDDTDEELKSMIADFAFVDMLEKEAEKVEKNEEAYNEYK